MSTKTTAKTSRKVKSTTQKLVSPKKAERTAKKKPIKKMAAKKPVIKKSASKKPSPTKKIQQKPTVKSPPVVEKPAPIKSKLDKAFLKLQLLKLEEERAKYTFSAEQLEKEAEDLQAQRTNTEVQSTEESGEGDTTSQYLEMDRVMSAQAREVVEEIDDAIRRIQDGVYGICIDSGKPIPKKRLEAIPWASQTVEAKAGGLRKR